MKRSAHLTQLFTVAKMLWIQIILVVLACLVATAEDELPNTNFVQELLVRAQQRLTTDLYKTVSRHYGNVVISPWSVMSLLAVTWMLAGGKTAIEIGEHMSIPLLKKKETLDGFERINKLIKTSELNGSEYISFVNAAFVGGGLHASKRLQKILQENLDTYINNFISDNIVGNASENVNDTLTTKPEEIINEFVESKSKGQIRKLLPPSAIPTNETALWLFNALYFQGTWQHLFHKHFTHQAIFKVDGKHAVKVPTMVSKAEYPCTHYAELQMTLLELPYGQEGRHALFVLLPDNDEGLAQLEKRLKNFLLESILSDNHWSRLMKVYLPKFKFETSLDLLNVMKQLGFKRMFTPDEADFPRLVGDVTQRAYVGDVIHRAMIEVNENGTTAAATSKMQITTRGFAYIFRADHPFMFVLRDKLLGINLFVGRVADPQLLR